MVVSCFPWLVILNFGLSAPGRACISIREDEIASEAMGINTTKYKTIAFVIGAMIAALAGALYACNFYVVKPDLFTWTKSVDILILVVFGGMGSFTGSVLAAIVIGFPQYVLTAVCRYSYDYLRCGFGVDYGISSKGHFRYQGIYLLCNLEKVSAKKGGEVV